jgi:HEAT repeat protein
MKTSINYKKFIEGLASKDFEKRQKAIEVVSALHSEDIYQEVSNLLDSDDAVVRNASISVMTAWGQKITDLIIKRTESTSENQKIYACNILGDIKDPKAVDTLLSLLTDDDGNVRFAAAEAIGKIGSKTATISLLHYLHSRMDEPWEQFPLILTLGEIKDERSVLPLLHLAENEMLKQPVLQAISNIGDEHAIPYILEVLKSDDLYLQQTAVLATKKMKDKVSKFPIIYKDLQKIIQVEFEKFKSRELHTIIDNLKNNLHQDDYTIKLGAIFLLGLTDSPEALKILIDEYSSDLLPEIEESIYTLSLNNHQILLKSLQNSETRCKDIIMKVLGKLKIQSDYDLIVSHLRNQLPEVRIETINALGEILNIDSIPELLNMLEDSNYDVQESAINAIIKFPNEEIFPLLKERFKNNSNDLDYVFVKIISQLKPKVSLDDVIKFSSSPDFQVRRTVAESLKNYNEKACLEKLLEMIHDSHYQVREAVIRTLSYFGEEITDNLISLSNDNSPWVRYCVAKSLESHKNEKSLKTLSNLLQDEIPFVKIAAMESIGNIKEERFYKTLTGFINNKDSDIASSAILALSKFNLPEKENALFFELLEKQTDNKNWIVRKSVAFALGQIKYDLSYEILMTMLAQENDSLVDSEIITSIGNLPNKNKVIPTLISFTKFEDFSDISLDVLANLGKDIIPFIQKELNNPDSEVRINLVSVLSKIEDDKSIQLLTKLASEDSSPNVRKHAILSLSKFIHTQKAIWAVMWVANHDSDIYVRKSAKDLLVP